MLTQLRLGVTWTYTSIAIGAVIQLGVTVATARLLDPTAFGLVAMASVLLRFGAYVAQMGVGRALVQKPTIDNADIRAAFTSSALLGVAVTATIWLLAPFAAGFYQNPDVALVIRWLALTIVLAGLGATAQALLLRQLRFRAIGAIEVLSYALGYAVPTLTMAAAGFGVWSLVAGVLCQAGMAGLKANGLARHALLPSFNVQDHRRLLGFGAKVSLVSFFEYIGSTLDTLVIGRFGSPTQVGLYNRAHTLAGLPTYHLNQGIAKVLFPVLSGGQEDGAAFRETLHRATGVAIKIVLSVGIGMALAAPELVMIVLGPKWSECIPLFAVLAVGLAINLLSTLPGLALEAVGVLREKIIVQIVFVALLALALVGFSLAKGLVLFMVVIIIAVANTARTCAFFVIGARAGFYQRYALLKHMGTAIFSACLGLTLIGGAVGVARAYAWPQEAVVAAAVAAGTLQLAILFGWNRVFTCLQGLMKSARWKQNQP